jgi:hypothetical protein
MRRREKGRHDPPGFGCELAAEAGSWKVGADRRRKSATNYLRSLEGVAKASLQFEPNAGTSRRFCSASDDHHIIAVTAEWLEAKRVYLGAAQPRAATTCRQKRCPPCGQNAVRGQPRASSTSIISR